MSRKFNLSFSTDALPGGLPEFSMSHGEELKVQVIGQPAFIGKRNSKTKKTLIVIAVIVLLVIAANRPKALEQRSKL